MGALGQWTFPDGSVILQNGASATVGQQFYITKNSHQLIRLARRETTNPLTPTGSYCCTVPTTGRDMTLCANLGEWNKLSLNYVLCQPVCVHPFHEFMKPSQLSKIHCIKGVEIGHATEY